MRSQASEPFGLGVARRSKVSYAFNKSTTCEINYCIDALIFETIRTSSSFGVGTGRLAGFLAAEERFVKEYRC